MKEAVVLFSDSNGSISLISGSSCGAEDMFPGISSQCRVVFPQKHLDRLTTFRLYDNVMTFHLVIQRLQDVSLIRRTPNAMDQSCHVS